MAYSEIQPQIICGNLLHYGKINGECKLVIPCGFSKIIIHSNVATKFSVNFGIQERFNNGVNFAPDTVITFPTDYTIIPCELFLYLTAQSNISVEVVENKGIPSKDYYTKINEKMYDLKNDGVKISPVENFVGAIGDTATFTINNNYVKYQWERSVDNGETWSNSTAEGSTTNSVSFLLNSQSQNGVLYRCKVVNTFGFDEYSSVGKVVIESESNAKAPTVEELENDEKVVKIEVDKEEAKEIFDNVSRETLNEKEE